jgi:hypothetical protein
LSNGALDPNDVFLVGEVRWGSGSPAVDISHLC